MPSNLTYPGVYIEEVPSGVRTITGVSTSVTAFIGKARKGPDDKAVLIHNFTEFERTYGGLWKESYLGYVVDHFFSNGGTEALIIRVTAEDAKRLQFEIKLDGIPKTTGTSGTPGTEKKITVNFESSSPGRWAEDLLIEIDAYKDSIDPDLYAADETLVNLFVYENANPKPILLESFRNVSFKESSGKNISKVLNFGSELIRVTEINPKVDDKGSINRRDQQDDPLISKPSETDVNEAEGGEVTVTDIIGDPGPPTTPSKTGLHLLEDVDIFNLLCIPALKRDQDDDKGKLNNMYGVALTICQNKNAFLILDPLFSWTNKVKAIADFPSYPLPKDKNMAIFFPLVKSIDTENESTPQLFPPCGMIAGVMARTDTERGPWKSAAGLDAQVIKAIDLGVSLNDYDNGDLNKLGINCLRTFFGGPVIWGARTLRGDDRAADTEGKYISVRRMILYLKESLYRGTQWVIFEPNDEKLWAQIRLNVGAFMQDLFVKGAFQGTDPKKAYVVKCDSETTTQTDIDKGIVNLIVGVCLLRPVEFLVIKITQQCSNGRQV